MTEHVRIASGPVARLAERHFVRRWLNQFFDYRRERIGLLLSDRELAPR